VRDAEVRDGGGKPVAVSRTDRGVVFEALHPDVYTVSAPVPGEQVPGEQIPAEQILVVANVSDPDYSLINRTHLADTAAAPAGGRSPARFWSMQLWMLLLLFAGALLLVEWTAFTRRFTA